jgi:multiple sugar transport system permease protein
MAADTAVPVRGRDRTAKIVLYILLILGLLVVVGPFIWMALASFKPEAEIRAAPPTWWPHTWTLGNYDHLFTRLDFPRYFTNSLVVAVLTTAGNLLFCSLLGYALAKLTFPGRRVLFLTVLGMLMVPGMVLFVPQFVLVSNLGLANSYAGLVLPFLAGPFGVFLMRQFLQSIPDDLLEAARVDGAGEWRIFWRVVLPLCRPALATLGILTFLTSWNNFLWPLIAITSPDQMTVPLGLSYFHGAHFTQWPLLMAANVMSLLPMLLVFVVAQRYFVQSVAGTGLKG